jgi:hypothetical protein
MYQFWDTLIEPFLESITPKTLVEIGSDEGDNTRRLLEFCEHHDARLHVIDPVPKYDVAAWEKQYGERLIFHRALSLEALPEIGDFEAVLIDGDHNWYTVYNELKIIEGRCNSLSLTFPLVMLHDVGWPYGRRDGYYDPSNVPEEGRQAYEHKGMKPNSSDLLKSSPYNESIANATSEGGPRNGVLTAIEDFVAESGEDLELLLLPGLHGFGLLFPSDLPTRNAGFADLVSSFTLSSRVERYVDVLEAARLEAHVRAEIRHRKEKREAEEHRKEQAARIAEQAARIAELRGQLDEIKSSRSWRLINRMGSLRSKVRKG